MRLISIKTKQSYMNTPNLLLFVSILSVDNVYNNYIDNHDINRELIYFYVDLRTLR